MLRGKREDGVGANQAEAQRAKDGADGALEGVGSVSLYQGAFSLQNALRCALQGQKSLPKYGRREVLVLMGAMATLDALHPAALIQLARGKPNAGADSGNTPKTKSSAPRTTFSFIHLAAELYICKRLAQETGGALIVPLSEKHLTLAMDAFATRGPSHMTKAISTFSTSSSAEISLLSAQLSAVSTENESATPPDEEPAKARLLTMGFPVASSSLLWTASVSSATSTPVTFDQLMESYSPVNPSAQCPPPSITCPRCQHSLPISPSALPTNCTVCRLMLVKSHQLARSYPHLFEQPILTPAAAPPPSSMNAEPTSPHICSACFVELDMTPQPQFKSTGAAKSASSKSTPFGPASSSGGSAASSSMAHIQYQCISCQALYCSLCKEGVISYLHQCPSCLLAIPPE